MNPAVLGKDVSAIIGNDYPAVGVAIQSAADAEKVIAELKPDVCIIATRSTVAELEDIFTICAKNGVNAITTCEEALYPWNSSPALTAKLDALAKEGGCTLTGVGYCDLFWGTMVTNLMGSSFEVKKITGSSWYDVEDYGIALAEGHGAGLTLDEFEEKIATCNQWSSDEIKQKVLRWRRNVSERYMHRKNSTRTSGPYTVSRTLQALSTALQPLNLPVQH